MPNNPVNEANESVPQGTTEVAEGVPEEGTTQESQGDVEKDLQTQLQELKQKADELEQLREQDVAKVKSSLQRQIAEKERQQEEERVRLEQELHKARMAHMDEDERERYESQMREQRIAELERRNAELQEQNRTTQMISSYRRFFAELGINPDELNDESVEDLVQSGWQATSQTVQSLKEELKQAKAELEELRTTPTKEEPKGKTPPPVSKPGGAPATGTSWAALKQRYGSMERVFSLIEQGRLSPDVLPD